MKSVLPDTGVIIDLLDGDRTFENELSSAERIVVTPSVIAEFMAGISNARRDKAKQSAFDALIGNPSVEVVVHDQETANYYASIYRYLKDQGTMIPLGDIWIAASAMQHGATILAKDRHYTLIPVMPVILGQK